MASRSMGHVIFPGQVALTSWLQLYQSDYSRPLPSLLWLPSLWPNLPLIISICSTDREPTLCDGARCGCACINTTILFHLPHKNMKLKNVWGQSEVNKWFLSLIINNPQGNSIVWISWHWNRQRSNQTNQKAFYCQHFLIQEPKSSALIEQPLSLWLISWG